MKKILSTTLAVMVSLLVLTSVNSLAAEKSLMMATTTSTDNTGLLDYLIPHFTTETGIEMKWTATGTGKALKLGSKCDVDVLLVHAPGAEAKFIDQGFGKDRREIMYNDFVIIGPKNDPAGVKGKSVAQALDTIRDAGAAFASRGDDSGTNKKEKILWKETGKALPEKEAWYVQTGQGMLATINVCEERNAYTMTDRGTYIKYQSQKGGNAPLVVLVEGDSVLLNQYSVLTLNPENCPNAKYDLALAFSNWMASESAQALIKNFRLLDKKLFIPNAK
ncbi:MAG: substrate-binding domain-containing protein [Desulfobacterium sp.]